MLFPQSVIADHGGKIHGGKMRWSFKISVENSGDIQRTTQLFLFDNERRSVRAINGKLFGNIAIGVTDYNNSNGTHSHKMYPFAYRIVGSACAGSLQMSGSRLGGCDDTREIEIVSVDWDEPGYYSYLNKDDDFYCHLPLRYGNKSFTLKRLCNEIKNL